MDAMPHWSAESLKEMREYSWNYFIAFAQARLTTFRFYLTFCTILTAGLAALMSVDRPSLAAALSLLLSFLSFIYWKIDTRHKDLIKHAERALEFLETQSPPPESQEWSPVLRLFHSEAEREKNYKRFPRYFSPKAYFSYSTSVNLVFAVFGLGGIVLAIVLILL